MTGVQTCALPILLHMSFMPAIKRILQEVPNQRQTLLFSATFDAPIKQLAQQFMRNPVEIQVAARNSVAETVTHRVHPVDGARKRDLLLHLLGEDSRRQTLVFRDRTSVVEGTSVEVRVALGGRRILKNKTEK